MRRFKKVDLAIQLIILIASFIAIISGDFPLFINVFFVGLLVWNLFSILLNFLFLDIRLPKLKNRRLAILIHTSMIVIYPCLAYIFQILADYSIFYILYVSVMPFYYLWMSYRELQLLDEIHDQVMLLDIGRH